MRELLRSRPAATVFVAVAATLWGLDALLRRPLAHSTSVATIVFGEHLALVLLALPLIPAALAAMWRLGWRGVAAAVGIGAGASAVATILFTQAFVDGDPVTPVVIQKVQPLVALVAARLLLGERPRQRFAWYFVPAVVGTWLMAFPHPTSIDTNSTLAPSLCARGGGALGVRDRPRALPRARPQVRARDDAPLHLRAARERDRAAHPRRTGLRVGTRLLLDRGARARHRGVGDEPLLLRPAQDTGGCRHARRARVPGHRGPGRLLQVRCDADATQWVGVAVTSLVVALLPARPRGTVELPVPAPVPA